MNKKFDIKNVRYELISSSNPKFKEVQVLFDHQGHTEKYFIFIDDKGKKNYIREAKKIFRRDVKNGKVVQALKVASKGKHTPLLITSIVVVAAAAIAVAGYFTYKYLNSEPAPAPAVSHKFTFNGEHCRINGSLEYTHDIFENDQNVQYTIVADQEWKLPDTIASTDVSYNKDTGVITINEITKDITVNVSANPDPTPGAIFTVSFDANGGEVTSLNPITVETFHTIAVADKPTLADRAGYKEEEVVWKDKDNNTFTFGPEGTGTPVTENMVLKANWGAIETLTVHFHETDDITNDVEVNYGDKPVFYTPTTGEAGDTFLGWFKGSDDEAEDFPFDEPIYGETHAYAHWKKPGYTVMWVNNDGTILETDTGLMPGDTPHYDGDEPAGYVEIPYIYTFSGWSPAITPIDGDRVYVAQFAISKKIEGDVLMSFVIPDGGETINLTFSAGEGKTLEFNWGDDSDPETTLFDQTEIEHTYTNGGEYILKIVGNITSVANCVSFEDYDSTLTGLYLGNSITTIPDFAYISNEKLRNVIVSSRLQSIGTEAFSGCSSLTSINIPDSVQDIDNGAFSGCSSLTSINIPNGIEEISTQLFAYCTSLTFIDIPNSVQYIGIGAFSGCSSLISINIPDGIDEINDRLFADCTSLLSIDIPESVTAIGYGAFSYCSSLTDINIPASVTVISAEAFAGCASLNTITVDPSNAVFTSRDESGKECNAIITKVEVETLFDIVPANTLLFGSNHTVIPDFVTSIYVNALNSRAGLTSIVIPENVTAIGYGAFNGCSGLTSINIPANVTEIGEYAFTGCASLNTITVDPSNAVFTSRDESGNECYTVINKIEIEGTHSPIPANTLLFGSNRTVIPDFVTSIYGYAFSSLTDLVSIVIPENVTAIGDSAFSYCSGLTSVTISNGVKTISYDAFSYCSGLTDINIPASVIEIAAHAFTGCASLNTITVDPSNAVFTSRDESGKECNAIITLEAESFINPYTLIAGCNNTIIPDFVNAIGQGSFVGCNFTSIKIPKNIASIGHDAFLCNNLTVVDLTEFGESDIPSCLGDSFDNDNPNLKFYVDTGMKEKFIAADGWKEYNPDHFTEDPVPSI